MRGPPHDPEEVGGNVEWLNLAAERRRELLGSCIDAVDLDAMTFEPPRWLVEDMITEGLTILGGRPKAGKSRLCLQLARAIVEARYFLNKRTTRAAVLYAALEDSDVRLQKRLRSEDECGMEDRGLLIRTDFPRYDQGGFEELADYLTYAEEIGLVIIDTAGRFLPPNKKNADPYEHATEHLGKIHRLCLDRKASLILVTHMTKARSGDYLDNILGSTGMTAVADTIMALDQTDRGFALHARGRDIEELEIPLIEDGIGWRVGGAKERLTEPENAVLSRVVMAGDNGISIGDLSRITGKDRGNLHRILRRLIDFSLIEQKVKRGPYYAVKGD